MLPRAEDFIGQPLARQLLEGYLRKDRVAGTFLLLGEPGLGKTTLATIFGRAIVCENNRVDPRLWFCGHCYACRSIAAGDQPEFVIVRPAGKQITVEQIDDDHAGFASAALHPTLLSHRIFIIDDAHYLNEYTGNQLLKLLEEAPQRSVFILVSDKPELLLPTILSRGNPIRLSPLPESELAEVLERESSDPHQAQPLALQSARMAAGRYVDGLRLIAQPEWRDAIARLAGALLDGRGTVELARKASAFEFGALWAKQAADLGLSDGEAGKLVSAARKNELQRQALIASYDRAAWWLLQSRRPSAQLGAQLATLKQRINQNVDPLLAQVAFENALT